jgi:RNA polymerase sigma-70 factor (ECF subfamily)
MASGTAPAVLLPGALRKHSAPNFSLNAHVSVLYETHRDEIFRFLISQGLEAPIAQELTQDVFVALFVAIRRGDQLANEQAWLYTVASRSAVDWWRRHRKPTAREVELCQPAIEFASADPTPEVLAQRNQRIRRITSAIQGLPAQQRACIHLRAEGKRYREIATLLGVGVTTAAECLYAAIAHLRDVASD